MLPGTFDPPPPLLPVSAFMLIYLGFIFIKSSISPLHLLLDRRGSIRVIRWLSARTAHLMVCVSRLAQVHALQPHPPYKILCARVQDVQIRLESLSVDWSQFALLIGLTFFFLSFFLSELQINTNLVLTEVTAKLHAHIAKCAQPTPSQYLLINECFEFNYCYFYSRATSSSQHLFPLWSAKQKTFQLQREQSRSKHTNTGTEM